MTRLFLIGVVGMAWLAAQPPDPAPTPPPPDSSTAASPALNVNERYIVESVELVGADRAKLTDEVRKLMDGLVGQKAEQARIDEVTQKLGAEFAKRKVTQKIEKGSKAEHVKVVFTVESRSIKIEGKSDDLRLIYHSKLNWTFGGTARIPINDSGFALLAGALTDNDLRVERYSGLRGGFDQTLFHDHVRVGFMAETYRSQWNGAVLAAGTPDDIYRTRQNFEPTIEVQILPSLAAKAGVSFQRFEYQFPAARYLSAHSVISSLRFERDWTATSSGFKQSLEAGYDLRAATRSLGGEFAYARNAWSARYEARIGPNEIIADARFGTLGGFAPLAERFVLGNSQTLRGWNRFDVAPLGGSRMAHGTAEYRYRGFRVLYDRGAVWQAQDSDSKVRHSLGLGYIDDGITLVVAFPLRNGNITPLVMLGYTF